MPNIIEIAAVGTFIIGALFYADFQFNQAKIVTYLARKFF